MTVSAPRPNPNPNPNLNPNPQVPEEFLDEWTGEIMTDPVTLPSSQMTLERSSIERHLAADSIDPYNRSPLTVACQRAVQVCAGLSVIVDARTLPAYPF